MNRKAKNLDREVLAKIKMTSSLARGVVGLIPDMTDCDWDWSLADDLYEIEKQLATLLSRYYEPELYAHSDEGKVEAFYTILQEHTDELARKDRTALKDIVALCSNRKWVSVIQLRKAALALDIRSSEFFDWTDTGHRKENGAIQIRSSELIAWIEALTEEDK